MKFTKLQQVYSGAYTQGFFEALVNCTEVDTDMPRNLNSVFVQMFGAGMDSIMIDLIDVLHGSLGSDMPPTIGALSEHPETRYCFLLFFLHDFGDCLDGHLMNNDPRIYE